MTDLHDTMKNRQDDDLNWLARNVPLNQLRGWAQKVGEGFNIIPEGMPPAIFGQPMWFSAREVLARRAELQNKPDWHEAPVWAEWLMQDCIGTWVWHELEPFGKGNAWSSDGVKSFSRGGEVIGKWLGTLERRPQAAKSEPVSEPSSDDWHKRGELPPSGADCEVLLDGMWEQVFIVGFSRQGQPVIENRVGAVYECIDCQFRPLPAERERVAAELVDVMMTVPVSDRKTASESYMSMALAIYDHLHKESKS